MKNLNSKDSFQGAIKSLSEKVTLLEDDLQKKREKLLALKQELNEKELLYNQINSLKQKLSHRMRGLFHNFKLFIGGLIGRRDLRHFYSRKFKQKFEERKLKSYQIYLYEYGLTQRV